MVNSPESSNGGKVHEKDNSHENKHADQAGNELRNLLTEWELIAPLRESLGLNTQASSKPSSSSSKNEEEHDIDADPTCPSVFAEHLRTMDANRKSEKESGQK